MTETNESGFYSSYSQFKSYATPTLKKKHIRQFDHEFWLATSCRTDMRVLEIGCGRGLFLSYLRYKGVRSFVGIDQDPLLADVIPESVKDNFRAIDVDDYLSAAPPCEPLDRIVLYDVVEHLDYQTGAVVLTRLSQQLASDGQILIRVPNMSSPWGGQYQFGDITHKAAYNPSSMRQLAIACGLQCVSCFPEMRGRRGRRILEGCLHGLLDRVLVSPPEIWTGNFLAILMKPA